jgi:crotonobetainyl-CoA:carnitine CoA-transferase CaiB-like acyl-CoA transferase
MTIERRWPPVVLDLGVGLSAALVAKLMAELGASVTRIEPESGDPFYNVYPSYRLLRSASTVAPAGDLNRLLATADVCIVGGEDHPELQRTFDAADLSARHPRLVVLDLGAHLSANTKAVDLLIQARTGLCFEQFSQRPVCFATALPTYGAALLGTLGLWTALFERSRSGRGQVVSATMQQGTALFWSPFWMKAQRPDAAFDTITPKDVRHLIFECADGDYIQLVMGVPGAVRKLYDVLGIEVVVAADDRGHPKPNTPLSKYFGDHELIAPRVRKWRRAELLAAVRQVGLAAEAVLAPGACWNDEQVQNNDILRRDRSGWRYVGAPIGMKSAGEASRSASVKQASEAPRSTSVKQEREASRGSASATSAAPIGAKQAGEASRTSASATSAAPLDGIRVLDLGNFVAGPFSSRLLASLGADVIKVDPPSGAATISGYRTVYASNCGKRSLCVDMKTPEGHEVLARLCATADVVHHNFRVGVAERLGVDSARLRESNPSLIVLHATAYGSSGPKATHPGFDMVTQALCGHEMRAGGAGNPPLWYRSPFVDFATGTLGAIAVVAGLVRRQTTGMAVDTEVSLLNTALFLMSELVQEPAGELRGVGLLDHERTGFHPAESLYRTRDGWIAISARTDAMAERLAGVLQLSLPPRSTWSRNESGALAERIGQLDGDDLLNRLARADVWAERCIADGWTELCADDVARDKQLIVDVPDRRYGSVSGCLGPLMNFSRSKIEASALRAAPTLGQHSELLLAELGYSPENIQRLRDSRVIA